MPRSKEEFEKIRLATRNKILSVSLELFAGVGYQNTPISRIAKACGLSKSSLYHHFTSKEEILISILTSAYNEWKSAYGVKPSFENPFQELERSIWDSVNDIKKNPSFYKLMHNLQSQLPETFEVQRLIEEISGDKMEDYSALFAKMGLKDPVSEVYFFGATFSGAVNAFLLMGESYPIDSVVNRLLEEYKKH